MVGYRAACSKDTQCRVCCAIYYGYGGDFVLMVFLFIFFFLVRCLCDVMMVFVKEKKGAMQYSKYFI